MKGIIYKIVPKYDRIRVNDCYFGSTCHTVSERMIAHKNTYNNKNKQYANNISVFYLFDTYGFNNCRIEILEELHNCSSSELKQREAHYITENACINKNIPARTIKQWYQDNKQIISVYKKDYYKQNKEKILIQRKAYYQNKIKPQRDSAIVL